MTEQNIILIKNMNYPRENFFFTTFKRYFKSSYAGGFFQIE